MLVKLTNSRVLDDKMKRQILGGKDCTSQCQDDCNNDEQIRVALNGDSAGMEVNRLPPEN